MNSLVIYPLAVVILDYDAVAQLLIIHLIAADGSHKHTGPVPTLQLSSKVLAVHAVVVGSTQPFYVLFTIHPVLYILQS